jgi:hypothetical protein
MSARIALLFREMERVERGATALARAPPFVIDCVELSAIQRPRPDTHITP